MAKTRQFLVTIPNWRDESSPEQCAGELQIDLSNIYGTTQSQGPVTVRPLPDLAADDTDLELGFRALTAALRRWDAMNETCLFSEPVALSRGQIAALIAELSKERSERTGHVDQAALDAVLAIRSSDERPGPPVQKNARVQMIIIDAICRCMPEEGK